VNFQGYISVEYEANPSNPTPDVRACLAVLRDAARAIQPASHQQPAQTHPGTGTQETTSSGQPGLLRRLFFRRR
jgi:hypothetical protein